MRCLEPHLACRDVLADNVFEEFSSSPTQKRDRADVNHNKIISMGNFKKKCAFFQLACFEGSGGCCEWRRGEREGKDTHFW